MLAETVADEEASAEEIFAKAQDSADITSALGRLSPKHRDILLLYYTNNVTFEEIGTMLEESPNTVKSRHWRALKALVQEMKESESKSTKDAARNV